MKKHTQRTAMNLLKKGELLEEIKAIEARLGVQAGGANEISNQLHDQLALLKDLQYVDESLKHGRSNLQLNTANRQYFYEKLR